MKGIKKKIIAIFLSIAIVFAAMPIGSVVVHATGIDVSEVCSECGHMRGSHDVIDGSITKCYVCEENDIVCSGIGKVWEKNETPHEHDLTYSSDDNILTATCSKPDCTLTGNKVSISIVKKRPIFESDDSGVFNFDSPVAESEEFKFQILVNNLLTWRDANYNPNAEEPYSYVDDPYARYLDLNNPEAGWLPEKPLGVGSYRMRLSPISEGENPQHFTTLDFVIEAPITISKADGSTVNPGVDYTFDRSIYKKLTILSDNLVISNYDDEFFKYSLFIGDVDHSVNSVTFKDLKVSDKVTVCSNDLKINIEGENQIGTALPRPEYGIEILNSDSSLTLTGNGELTIYDQEDGIFANGNADLTIDSKFTGKLNIDDIGEASAPPPPPCAISIGDGTLTINNGTLNLVSEKKNGITAGTININGGNTIVKGGEKAMSVKPTLNGVKVKTASESFDGSDPVTYEDGNISSYMYLEIVPIPKPSPSGGSSKPSYKTPDTSVR